MDASRASRRVAVVGDANFGPRSAKAADCSTVQRGQVCAWQRFACPQRRSGLSVGTLAFSTQANAKLHPLIPALRAQKYGLPTFGAGTPLFHPRCWMHRHFKGPAATSPDGTNEFREPTVTTLAPWLETRPRLESNSQHLPFPRFLPTQTLLRTVHIPDSTLHNARRERIRTRHQTAIDVHEIFCISN